jgi:hypothetical protein
MIENSDCFCFYVFGELIVYYFVRISHCALSRLERTLPPNVRVTNRKDKRQGLKHFEMFNTAQKRLQKHGMTSA